MNRSSVSPKANKLLAALPTAAYRRLLPDLEATTLLDGDVLFRPADRLKFAYFPTTSIVTLSYAVEEDGTMAKAWPVGREGMVGISLFLGGSKRDNRAETQIGGGAYRLPASALRAEFRKAGAFQQLLLRYVFALVTQASQLGVCSHYHSIEQRFCRFLCSVDDRVPGNEVLITHARIGSALGVRRESITEAAFRLQAAGLIEYQRGHIRIVSRKKLEQHACSCGATIRGAFSAATG